MEEVEKVRVGLRPRAGCVGVCGCPSWTLAVCLPELSCDWPIGDVMAEGRWRLGLEGGGLHVGGRPPRVWGGGVQQLGRNEDDWCGFLCDRKWRCCCKF